MNSHDIQDYRTAEQYETFSYLPALQNDEIRDQVAFLVAQGWTPAIEHEHPARAMMNYWPMWKLPFFGETDVNAILQEVEACHRAYPDHHVRLIGYDDFMQTQGLSFLVYRARG